MRVEQKPNYELIIKTNKYTGNFERELISYSLGTLDNVQMELGDFHGDYEMDLFWEEEFNTTRKDYYDDYELKDEYLFETYQDVDDWEQMTFYHIVDGNSLAVQLIKPLNEYWEEIVVRRIKKFFDVHPCKYTWTLPEDGILIELYLIDKNGNVIKKYI
jgi:hypothetical protein